MFQSFRSKGSSEQCITADGLPAREKTILLADDNPYILETIAARLRDNGNEVITATNGQEAVDEGTRIDPDLAILDVSMPVMNGLEAAEQLHKNLPHLSIILFTSYAEMLKSTMDN